MKRWTAACLFLAVLVSGTAGAEDFRIGVLLPLTGKLASWGVQGRNGATLAAEQAVRELGVTVRINADDSEADPKKAVSVAKRFIEVDKIKVLLAVERSSSILALAPIAERSKTILFSSSASADEISSAGDYVFRNRETGKVHGTSMARYLTKRGIKSAAILAALSANSLGYPAAFRPVFKSLGGSIKYYDEYREDSTDFRTELAKARSTSPEAFYLSPTSGQDGGLIVKQLRETGFSGLIASHIAVESEEFLAGAGEAGREVVYTYPDFDPQSRAASAFAAQCVSRFGITPDIFAANTYDAVLILARGFASCGGDKTDCLKQFLYNVRDYPGAGGMTSFDKNGDAVKPIIIKKVTAAGFERLGD